METTISEGAIPKLTISARESNSFPIVDETFNSLATNPSKKSKTVPNSINNGANNMPFSQLYKVYIDNMPHNKLQSVTPFGICFRIIFNSFRGSKLLISCQIKEKKMFFLRVITTNVYLCRSIVVIVYYERKN